MNTLKILIDADAFVALNNADDPNYASAVRINKDILELQVNLVTSDPAFGEAVTVISQKSDIKIAVEFAEDILSSDIQIVEVNSHLRRQALDVFKKQGSKNSRFTDCVNMAIMKEEGIDTIFSFDKHYKKNGFKRFGIDE